jgi:hypothetical protein
MKPNGHDKNAAAGGQALPASSREACTTRLHQGGAASDDPRAFPAAAGANAPAGMERDGCAELAPPREVQNKKKTSAGQRTKSRCCGQGGASAALANHDGAEQDSAVVDIPPGIEPLPADGPGFVDAMHAHVDLYLACARLVKSADEKIAQRMVERLLEMSYGKSPAPAGEDAAPIIFDAPRPPRE